MITISTRDYTTEQLKDLVEGLSYSVNRIFDSPECQKYADCKAYAICHDLGSTRQYIWKKIWARETIMRNWIDRTYNDYKLLKTLERWMNL